MNVPDILEFLVDFWRHWRFCVCLGISILLAFSIWKIRLGSLGVFPFRSLRAGRGGDGFRVAVA